MAHVRVAVIDKLVQLEEGLHHGQLRVVELTPLIPLTREELKRANAYLAGCIFICLARVHEPICLLHNLEARIRRILPLDFINCAIRNHHG
jgi:hypothetical protein